MSRVDVRSYRDALKTARALPIATRGVLFVLAQFMNADGSNGRPGHDTLAADCGITARALARHLSAAVTAGYLRRVSGGHNGRAAVYEAVIPTAVARQQRPPTPPSSQTGTSPNGASSRTSTATKGDRNGRVAGQQRHPTSYDLEKTSTTDTTLTNLADIAAKGYPLADILRDLRAADIYSPTAWINSGVPTTAVRTKARDGYIQRQATSQDCDAAFIYDTPYDATDEPYTPRTNP